MALTGKEFVAKGRRKTQTSFKASELQTEAYSFTDLDECIFNSQA